MARARYQRWFSEDEALPANRVGRELRLLEIVVEMDHHRVEDVLHILPFRHWVRGDGKLDASAAMRLAVKRFDLLGPGSAADAQTVIDQLEADANYFWVPTDRELEALGMALLKRRLSAAQLAELRAAVFRRGSAPNEE
ncbi:MAG: hypothetical protein AABZ83_10250 [candidate division NC10 bacterium]